MSDPKQPMRFEKKKNMLPQRGRLRNVALGKPFREIGH